MLEENFLREFISCYYDARKDMKIRGALPIRFNAELSRGYQNKNDVSFYIGLKNPALNFFHEIKRYNGVSRERILEALVLQAQELNLEGFNINIY